jgi:glycosyltransferase involved in cell wall biosynthesis
LLPMALNKKKLIYFYPVEAPFVDKDVETLSDDFSVKKINFNPKGRNSKIIILINQFIILIKEIFTLDGIIVKFAGIHSLLPALFCKIFRKKLIIISGGTDCVSFPSFEYGNFYPPLTRFITKLSFRYANFIIPVHESLMITDYEYSDDDYDKQGLLFHYPELTTPYMVVYNGYSALKWYKNSIKKKNTFITVASYSTNDRRRKLKGIDLIIEIAKHFENSEFIIIGTDPDTFPKRTANITLLPWVDNQDLINHYSSAEFYLQLSVSEGFPNSLCEAMLCECVPVVSNVNSMPFIVGDTGFVLERKDINLLKELLE